MHNVISLEKYRKSKVSSIIVTGSRIKHLKYKGYTGTVHRRFEHTSTYYYGTVMDVEVGLHYGASTLEDLYNQFKNAIKFYEQFIED